MNFVYRPKSLVSGYKIGLSSTVKVVAVPNKMITKNNLNVVYNGETMIVNNQTPVLKSISFDDKFGRGKYTLNYYDWTVEKGLFGLS